MSDQHKPTTNKGRSFHEVDLAGMREAISTGDRLLGIELANGRAHVRRHGRRIAAGLEHDRHGPRTELRDGIVEPLLGHGLRQIDRRNGLDDADDGEEGDVILCAR